MSGLVKRSVGLSQRNFELASRFSQATLAREHHAEIVVTGRNMFAGASNGFSKASCRSFVITVIGNQQPQPKVGHGKLTMRRDY